MHLFGYIACPLLVSYTQPHVYCQLAIFASSLMIDFIWTSLMINPQWIIWKQKVHSELLGFCTFAIVWYSTTRKHNVTETICFCPQVMGETPALLGPLNHWIHQLVQCQPSPIWPVLNLTYILIFFATVTGNLPYVCRLLAFHVLYLI
jgi:hypothetical protein